jgi:hypothetical protein
VTGFGVRQMRIVTVNALAAGVSSLRVYEALRLLNRMRTQE